MYNNLYPPLSSYQQPTQIVRVNGIQGAKAYQMPPNSTAALFDANEDIFYIRITDGAGFPSIRSFSFTEIVPQNQNSNDSSATIARIERIEADILQIKEALSNGKQPVRKQPDPE